MQIILVRHGHPLVPTSGPTTNPPLSERGHTHAQCTAEALGSEAIEAIWSSGLQRADTTAEPLVRSLGLNVRTLPGLGEIDRVEVLRGPQGTLYGRNTTGGAINFITRKPDLQGANGYATVGYGNYDTLKFEGAVEATLVPDKLGIRIAGTRSKGDGYTFNPTLNRDFATSDSVAGRVSLRWKPSDDIDINLKGYYAKNDPLQDLPYGIGYLAGRTNAAGY